MADRWKERWGMVIDLDKCTACQACTVACKQENNQPFNSRINHKKGKIISWNEVLRSREVEGKFPEAKLKFIPRPCMHCAKPSCVTVCPVGATHKDMDRGGAVLQRYERCIGCRYCAVACPYGVRQLNWFDPEHANTESLNPDSDPDKESVSVRPRNVIEKCTFCIHRLEKAKKEGKKIGSEHYKVASVDGTKGTDIEDNGVVPACVQTCPGGARYFGDLNDPKSTVSKLIKERRAFRLLEEKGNYPNVYYLEEG